MTEQANPPVVVGIDGSDNAHYALGWAARYARAVGAHLIVVHALGLTENIDGEHVTTFGRRDEIEQRLEAWSEPAREFGVADVESRLIDGSPVDVLLRVAREVDASTIVVGRRGVGAAAEQMLGSTAHQVIEHARRPVFVVPPRSETVGEAES